LIFGLVLSCDFKVGRNISCEESTVSPARRQASCLRDVRPARWLIVRTCRLLPPYYDISWMPWTMLIKLTGTIH